MKDSLTQDRRLKDARLSPEQMEEEKGSLHFLTRGDAYQGIEFLNDALRMEDQTFEDAEENKKQ